MIRIGQIVKISGSDMAKLPDGTVPKVGTVVVLYPEDDDTAPTAVVCVFHEGTRYTYYLDPRVLSPAQLVIERSWTVH